MLGLPYMAATHYSYINHLYLCAATHTLGRSDLTNPPADQAKRLGCSNFGRAYCSASGRNKDARYNNNFNRKVMFDTFAEYHFNKSGT